ncbi:MAG: PilZ domain-containing protein [Candidatus Omnitrophota bacterium]
MTKEFHGFEERRKFVRASVYATIRYVCPFRGIDVEVRTQISDISEGGVQIVSFMEKIPEGAPVKMSFVTPGDQGLYITVEGIARHTKALDQDAFRTGIEFVGLKEGERTAIRKYVASRAKK